MMSYTETQIDSTDTEQPQPVVCLVCGSELMTDFVSSSQSTKVALRCGGCGDLIGTGVKTNAPVDKRAWWSLWLGLMFPFLFFTGIPAVYLGIRSLLRMRYTSFRLGDRRAAIAGTSLGAVNVLFGLCVIGTAIAIVSSLFSTDQTNRLAQAKIAMAGAVSVELPDKIVYGAGDRRMNLSKFEFRDAEKRDDVSCRIIIYYFPPAMIGASTTLGIELRSRKLRGDATYSEIESTKLRGNLAGKPTTFSKHIDKESIDRKSGQSVTSEVHQYIGFVNVDQGIYAVCCTLRQPNEVFPDEASVVAFFNSLLPTEKIRISQAWKDAMATETEKAHSDKSDQVN